MRKPTHQAFSVASPLINKRVWLTPFHTGSMAETIALYSILIVDIGIVIQML